MTRSRVLRNAEYGRGRSNELINRDDGWDAVATHSDCQKDCDMRQPRRKFGDLPDNKRQAVGLTVDRYRETPRVLVVDDEHMVRIMVQMGLERNGFDVLLARNGREAIELYGQHAGDIAVVLLDVSMPRLDGLETLKLLRELNPGLVACFMTGDAVADELVDLIQDGLVSCIAKPFRLDDLADVVRMIADRSTTDLEAPGRVFRQA